jgi:hypothetical protein
MARAISLGPPLKLKLAHARGEKSPARRNGRVHFDMTEDKDLEPKFKGASRAEKESVTKFEIVP